ncbi:hypothetical protein CU102_12540 [Phyllobacterium brassicacearum]|uniref:DNA 3'-5' helicase n=1 Tax=Phyllobacterium brassicacearum TaxID=314235 RepID=A0A2P7BQ62_9HYPH|nr:UvrD-helicase domain-containing protein [Phyllobacterium brassicacearum]PSH68586.1 hypothetical protein CU102_12540 [Phyllobacterium brassicacearum]TDQ24133.1 UvrD-like helicase family protein [Phyllobacterium brassicacearum]
MTHPINLPIHQVGNDDVRSEEILVTADPRYQDDPDNGQKTVIRAAPEDRLLVDAGPGTGKTHVACHRVASLIENGVPASRIWIVSFARTAVHEIRNRLAATLEDAGDAESVRIATLDSYAWSIQSGFSAEATLSGNYDHNIQKTLSKVLKDEDVRDDLRRTRHLIVDEAQDIIGPRAEFVLAIVDVLNAECGVTVFADQAQAIYGFTEDDALSGSNGVRLLDGLVARGFGRAALSQVHRTNSPELLEIFIGVRKKVLDDSVSAAKRGAQVRGEIVRLAHEYVGPTKNLRLAELSEAALVLMRRRCDVLIASSYNQDVPHRLRMSGLPPCVPRWVGLLFWDHIARKLTRSEFHIRWHERIANGHGIPSIDEAWTLLFEAAGESDTVIDLHHLRAVLARSNPPVPFTSPEFGEQGPIIGTIHASKGREAEEVCLYLPPTVGEGSNEEANEEIRVMFVGATRARKRLSIGDSPGTHSSQAEGRVWKFVRGGVQIEVGRSYDIDAEGLVGKSAFPTQADALEAQGVLIKKPIQQRLFASADKTVGWNLALKTRDNERVGVLSRKLKDDLTTIANMSGTWPPPSYLPFIRSAGIRTIAVRPDDPRREQLHEPWCSSGFLLAPMLIGFSRTKLGDKKT